MSKETMNKYKEVLEKLRSGEMALDFGDATLGQIQRAMEIVKPLAINPVFYRYSFVSLVSWKENLIWDYFDTNPCSSSITVTEFLALWESQNDEGKGDYPVTKVVLFELKDGKYLARNGKELTTDFVLQHEHEIFDNGGYIVIP